MSKTDRELLSENHAKVQAFVESGLSIQEAESRVLAELRDKPTNPETPRSHKVRGRREFSHQAYFGRFSMIHSAIVQGTRRK